MSNASRGSAFERQVKERFEAAGWYVTRAAGSHGCADLLAIEPVAPWPDGRGGEIAFVQAKLGGPGRLSPAEWDELFSTAMRYGGVPLIAHRPKRGKIEFLRILGPKTGGRGARPPVDEWRLPELEAADAA